MSHAPDALPLAAALDCWAILTFDLITQDPLCLRRALASVDRVAACESNYESYAPCAMHAAETECGGADFGRIWAPSFLFSCVLCLSLHVCVRASGCRIFARQDGPSYYFTNYMRPERPPVIFELVPGFSGNTLGKEGDGPRVSLSSSSSSLSSSSIAHTGPESASRPSGALRSIRKASLAEHQHSDPPHEDDDKVHSNVYSAVMTIGDACVSLSS